MTGDHADPLLTVLAYRFPGVPLWFGRATGSWWALVDVRDGWRLVEAVDVEELTRAILHAESWPHPFPLECAGPGAGQIVTRWDCPVVATAR